MDIFINEKEQRLRAGWRLLFQFLLMISIISVGAFGSSYLMPDLTILSSAIPMFFGVIISVWIAAQYFDKRPITNYGIVLNKTWVKEFLIGAGIAAVAQGVIFLIELWTGWLTITSYGWNVPQQNSFGLGITSFFVAMLMVGFHEELFSRGYQVLNITEGLQYPSWGHHSALIIAILLTSSLFGILHIFNPNASVLSTFNIILAGVVLAIPYVLTGSLALSVGLHFSWNFVMAGIFGFPVSGMEIDYSIIHINQGGSELITGGAFGPEAGLIGLLGMAIMLGGSCVYIKRTRGELTVAEIFRKDEHLAVESDEQAL